MSANFDRGAFIASTWHGQEEICQMSTAADMLHEGYRTGAWPTGIDLVPLSHVTDAGSVVASSILGTLATYQNHPQRILGAVGDRYRACDPAEWRGVVEAACAAGAKPDGAFSLFGGAKVLATFDLGERGGLRNKLMICDSFDGSCKLMAGFTSVRVVCSNTLAAAFYHDGAGMAKLRHTASLAEKIKILEGAIGKAIEDATKLADAYADAERIRLTPDQQRKAFDILFPPAVAKPGEDAPSAAAITRAENRREEAKRAAAMPINRVGSGTLATLWNAATYLVDRTVDEHGNQSARPCRGDADRLESMLFGARAQRVAQIQELVEVIRTDGTVERMTVDQAADHGIGADQVARSILADLGL